MDSYWLNLSDKGKRAPDVAIPASLPKQEKSGKLIWTRMYGRQQAHALFSFFPLLWYMDVMAGAALAILES